MKYSILIPCSNIDESLFHRCIQRIINFKAELQLVIVFDETSEHLLSKLIVPDYIKLTTAVIKKTTLSYARNICMNLAEGDWSIWCDIDDLLMPTTLLTLSKYLSDYQNLDDLDAICYPAIFGKKRLVRFKTGLFDIRQNPLLPANLPHTVWQICMKTELFKKFNIALPEHIYKYEDLLLTLLFLTKCRNILVIEEPLYSYFIYPNSLSHKVEAKEFGPLSMYQIYIELTKNYMDVPKANELYSIILNKIRHYMPQLKVSEKDRIDYELKHNLYNIE